MINVLKALTRHMIDVQITPIIVNRWYNYAYSVSYPLYYIYISIHTWACDSQWLLHNFEVGEGAEEDVGKLHFYPH